MMNRPASPPSFTAYPNLRSEIHLYGMHQATVERGWACGRHLHHMMFEINLVLQGCQTVQINEEEIELQAGDWIMMPPMQLHAFKAKHPGTMSYFVMHIQIADPTFLQLLTAADPILFSATHPLTAEIRPILASLMAQLDAPSGRMTLFRQAFELMATLESYYTDQARHHPSHSENQLPFLIAKEIERLVLTVDPEADGLSANWLEMIANKLGISRRHGGRVFQQAYGMPPRQYLAILRQQEAMQLLIHTHDSIEQIAYRVGFQNPQSFIRQFSKWTGFSPGGFRKNREDTGMYLTPLEIRDEPLPQA